VADRESGGPSFAGLVLVDGVPLLRPEPQVFEAMLEGWRNQMLARNLAAATVRNRLNQVRAFADHCGAFPWEWSPQLADEWFADMRAIRHCSRSTVRGYQVSVRGFGEYVTDPAYGWAGECERRFGTHPIQVINEANAAAHLADIECEPSKRAFTRAELQALFDHADEQVEGKPRLGRKGWASAFRDATMIKVAYSYGLRRNETRMLDAADFGRNPDGAEFGEYGVVYVRHGKAQRGSPPKRRSVLTVWPWTTDVLEQWFTEVRPLFGPENHPAAWPSERRARIGLEVINHRLAAYRDALGLDPGLDFHSLRRSYVTHLIEDGWDPRFVQEQVGHDHASTTSIYTCVSSDFRTRTLRRVLDDMLTQALGSTPGAASRTSTAGPPEVGSERMGGTR
jgi:site-specific recombinase XerD